VLHLQSDKTHGIACSFEEACFTIQFASIALTIWLVYVIATWQDFALLLMMVPAPTSS